jgi:hypothetical protein
VPSPVERVTLVLVAAAATWLFGYASATPVVLLELAMVLAFLVAGIVIARSIALRRGPTTDPADSMGAP